MVFPNMLLPHTKTVQVARACPTSLYYHSTLRNFVKVTRENIIINTVAIAILRWSVAWGGLCALRQRTFLFRQVLLPAMHRAGTTTRLNHIHNFSDYPKRKPQ